MRGKRKAQHEICASDDLFNQFSIPTCCFFYIKEIKISILNILTSHSLSLMFLFVDLISPTLHFWTSKRLRQKLCFCQEPKSKRAIDVMGACERRKKYLKNYAMTKKRLEEMPLKKYSFLIQIFIFQFHPSLKWLCVCTHKQKIKEKKDEMRKYIDILTNILIPMT